MNGGGAVRCQLSLTQKHFGIRLDMEKQRNSPTLTITKVVIARFGQRPKAEGGRGKGAGWWKLIPLSQIWVHQSSFADFQAEAL
jgi:hypothetical protein